MRIAWSSGPSFPFIKQDWGLSDQALGGLTSAIYLTIAIFVVPLSILVDRWSRRKMISLMVFVWSLATLACAFTRNYGRLLAARALVGLGEAGYAPAGTASLAAALLLVGAGWYERDLEKVGQIVLLDE